MPTKQHRSIVTKENIDAALKAASELENEPVAASIDFIPKADLYVVHLSDGTRIPLLRENVQGLQSATRKQLAEVEINGLGTGLRWPSLDLDMYVPALFKGVYGNKAWMKQLGRNGGSVRSDAKATAARVNGTKGGRPKKTRLGEDVAAKAVRTKEHVRKQSVEAQAGVFQYR